MTFTLLVVIGAIVGWFLPRVMGGESYGIPADLGAGVGGALLGGLIFNLAFGGWIAGAIAAAIFAVGAVLALRQVKTVRDRQGAAAQVAARNASQRMRARSR